MKLIELYGIKIKELTEILKDETVENFEIKESMNYIDYFCISFLFLNHVFSFYPPNLSLSLHHSNVLDIVLPVLAIWFILDLLFSIKIHIIRKP